MKLSNIENRTFPEPPLIMAVTEKQAAVSFRLIDGKVDYASFFGDASVFHEWAKDLFCYFWNNGQTPALR
jgi:predicted transcriptional regulator